MASNAMFSITYGLYILTARDGEKDNGCVINTLAQLTSQPNRISITVNKSNYTHDMIKKTKVFNVSILTENTPFGVFEHFGFKSGRDSEKFFSALENNRSENGVLYIPSCTNAYVCAKVTEEIDLGTHTLFIADVTQTEVLSDEPSLSYAYYHENIKPKPKNESAKGYRCKICGYVYQGENLDENFICPICKHGAQDFEKI